MEEIFELIKAFNRLKEKIVELIGKVDSFVKTPPDEHKYLDEDEVDIPVMLTPFSGHIDPHQG